MVLIKICCRLGPKFLCLVYSCVYDALTNTGTLEEVFRKRKDYYFCRTFLFLEKKRSVVEQIDAALSHVTTE